MRHLIQRAHALVGQLHGRTGARDTSFEEDQVATETKAHVTAIGPSDIFPVDAWTAPQYQEWFEAHRRSEAELDGQRRAVVLFENRPFFSIIVPLYKTPLSFFHQMVDSVFAQTYERFELVLVNASPEDTELRFEVRHYQELDARVKVVDLEVNYGITENTNRGIEVATGDFCCFLDHDDVIEPDLLFEYAKAVNEDPSIDYLYCDEDMVTWDEAKGSFVHEHPLFKSGYSPELLLCKNYIIHMMTVRRDLIEAMPRPGSEFDGSQDYNMTLFATQRARRVHGVQRVLYHWRASDNSTATNPESKPYTIRSCRLAIEEQLKRMGIEASIIGTGIYDLYNLWFVPQNYHVSIVVDCGSDEGSTIRFLEYLRQSGLPLNAELILVNPKGAWADELNQSVRATSIICASDNLFRRLNKGASCARGDLLLFMDANSAFVSPEAIGQLSAMCMLDGVGCVGPKILYRNDINKSYGAAITPAGIFSLYRGYDDSFPGYECNIRCFQDVGALGWQGLMTRRDLFEKLGKLDEDFTDETGAAEYCTRVRREGSRAVAQCTVKLKVDEPAPDPRYGSAIGCLDYSAENLKLFDVKWPGYREESCSDCYNRNFEQATGYQQVPASWLADSA